MVELCQTFRSEAATVWNRMRHAARLGISLSEETITECALYDIAASHQGGQIVVDLATKPAESKHGADWEWWMVKDGYGVCFRIQAKRLYPSGKFQALRKSGPDPYQQLDKLVIHAQKIGACPLYCFYNYATPGGALDGKNACAHDYHGPSFWGCSVAFAHEVKLAGSDALSDLKPILFPWHYLVCGKPHESLIKSAMRFVNSRNPNLAVQPRSLPPRVGELIEFGSENRKSAKRDQLSPTFWQEDTDEELAGIAVFTDLR